MSQGTYTIGFANLSEQSDYAATVKQSLEEIIEQYDDLTLITRDNDLSDELAFENARYFSQQQVDFVLFFHINERIGMDIQTILRPIPVLIIDIPFPLAPHFGINNQQSGKILGEALAEWIETKWDRQVDRVLALVDSRVISLRDRTETAANYLRNTLNINRDDIFYLDCSNNKETTITNVTPILASWQSFDHIAVITFNADSTFGLISAAEQLNCLHKLAIVANAADHQLLIETQQPGTHVIATSFFDPVNYGKHLMELINSHRRGERLPQRTYMDMELHRASHPFVS